MTRMLMLVGCLFMAAGSFAQGAGYADSLKKLLRQHTAMDSNRVTLLLNLADNIIYESPDSAMHYTNEALGISQQLSWQKGISLSLCQKGNVLDVQSDKVGAMEYYQQALTAAVPVNNKRLDARIYNNIANMYSDMKQYPKALDYYNKLLAIARESNMRKEETIALINLGTVYTEQNDYPRALDCFQKSLVIAKADSNTRLLPFILSDLGIAYNQQNNYPEALNSFREAIALADKAGNQNAKGPALGGLGKVYFNLKDYAQAEKYSLQSLALGKEISSAEWQRDAYETLTKVYEKQHQSDKALGAYKNYIAYRDSVLNDEKRSEITRKDMQFEYERKSVALMAEQDKKQALAAVEISRQRIIKNAVVGGAAVLLLAGISIFVFYKRRRDAEGQKREAEFKAQVADTEMKVMRLQMNPHFIFNSLNSISDYISKHDIKAADYYLTRFAKVMRLILENSEQKEIRLTDELHALELYMQLESMRLNNKFTYEIKVDDAIDPEVTLVPPLLLQPFVENSIWHGLSQKTGEGKILVHIKKVHDMIHCIVEDNGIGRERSSGDTPGRQATNKKSLGVKITRARIDIINKIKKSNGAVELSDLPEGMRVEVKLPLELNF